MEKLWNFFSGDLYEPCIERGGGVFYLGVIGLRNVYL